MRASAAVKGVVNSSFARKMTDELLSIGLKQRSQSVWPAERAGLQAAQEITERCCFCTLPVSQRANSPSVSFGRSTSAGL